MTMKTQELAGLPAAPQQHNRSGIRADGSGPDSHGCAHNPLFAKSLSYEKTLLFAQIAGLIRYICADKGTS
jgi:hypothetical protein